MSLKGKPSTSTPAPVLKNTAAAPLVYFDGVPVYGASAGNVQVELACRMLAPSRDGDVVVDMVCTGHLRCSPDAARSLIDSLQKAIGMAEQAPKSPLLQS